MVTHANFKKDSSSVVGVQIVDRVCFVIRQPDVRLCLAEANASNERTLPLELDVN